MNAARKSCASKLASIAPRLQFELVWHRPDGSDRIRTLCHREAAFRARLDTVEAALKTEHWNINGSPQILSEGWRDAGPTKTH